ncbi:flagellar filament capping protein FliD [Phycisphaera mikurensis]|uniref:Filament cap protein n=1 Tax=Phycisphaera mikurensis (strain NBRC 102666 / KCTC 22515 / FYK2301M01) TaxID=1142394 RepID=I0IGJ2_PHYMF|nr:flagellar filament capping protein FliD [Phycisphaera mikurensis]MBB6442938.1 flagellar hook-associated protein 2 [Phycisphaera mikurensis]BAM04380.1 putative flagellar hook-associated protein 2 [Phycisphaera mikurensis NBRC 102666]
MGQFASSVGLVSGINSAEIIDQLIAIERRGVDRVEARNAELEETQTALNEVSAKLLSIKLDAAKLTRPTTFNKTTATSSNEEVATVTGSAGAAAGDYQVTVNRLVSSQQTVSRGFANASTQAVAPEPRLLAFSRNGSKLTNDTPLEALNGGLGVERGQIKIIDHTQKTRTLDLSGIASLQEVADGINALQLAVEAEVTEGGLRVSNLSNLSQTPERTVQLINVGEADVVGSLGLDGPPVNGEIVGRDLNTLGRETDLASLRDGRGVRFGAGDDLTFTTSGGDGFSVDLSGAATLGEVFDRIDEAGEGRVSLAVRADGRGLELTDRTAGGGGFGVSGTPGSDALAGLGLAEATASAGTITGERIRGGVGSKLLGPAFGGRGLAALGGAAYVPLSGDTALADLFGGAGLTTSNQAAAAANPLGLPGGGTPGADGVADLIVETADGSAFELDLDGLDTLDALLGSINAGLGGKATAFLQDDRLILADHTEGEGAFAVSGGPDGGRVAAELGLAGTARGGTAVGRLLDPSGAEARGSQVQIRNAAGGVTVVDFAGAETADDLIDRINAAGAGVQARLNSVGDGIALIDRSGGDEALRVSSVTGGVLAEQLGLAGEHRSGRVQGRSLQYGFAEAGTTLQSLGVDAGTFTIQDADGRRGTIDLTDGVPESGATLGDVIAKINAQGIALSARINDTGDGLLIESTGSGANAIEIVDVEGTAAAALRIGGSFEGASVIDGSLRTYVASGPGGTLQDLAQAISASGAGIDASVVNDGTAGRPFRLSLTGSRAGSAHGFTLDDGGLALRAENLSEARDALAYVGGVGGGQGVAVTSTSNQLVGVVPGATIDLLRASDEPVTINLAADGGAVTESVTAFVEGFNDLTSRLDELDSYDAETDTRGVLLGDPTVQRVRSSLYNAVINPNAGLTGRYKSLSEIGITVGSDAKLEIDSEKLEAAYATDPASVEQLFAFGATEAAEAALREPGEPAPAGPTPTYGIAVEINNLLDALTDVQFGSVQSRIDTLDRQIRQNNERIDRLNVNVDRKRERLQEEFAGLEGVLAGLQDQSASLGTLSQLASQSSGG